MNILDENIPRNQRLLLGSWRIRARQIGYDISRKGIDDEDIIPFLLQQPQPTFFTRDLGFYKPKLCHAKYCIVCLDVDKYVAATFVRRVLRHPDFNTKAKRMGAVIRVSSARLYVRRLHKTREILLTWM